MSSGYPEILAWRRFSPCIGWESMVSYFHLQDSYIGSTSASQAEEAGSTPVSCSKKKCHPNGWHFFLEYGPRSELVVRSQAFCRRQTAAMQRIAAFGAAKRKCAGTRRRPCRRSTPVRPIYLLIYNVLTTQKEAPSKRMAFLFGIRLPQRPLPVTIF